MEQERRHRGRDTSVAGKDSPQERRSPGGMPGRVSADSRLSRRPNLSEEAAFRLAASAGGDLLHVRQQEAPDGKHFWPQEHAVFQVRRPDVSQKDTDRRMDTLHLRQVRVDRQTHLRRPGTEDM